MRKWIVATVVFVMAVGTVTFVRSMGSVWDKADGNEMTARSTPVQDVLPSEKLPIKIDVLKNDVALKERLNHSPSVSVIDHSKKAKSHYLANQVVVKFKTHPGQKEMATMEREIDGELENNLRTICIFSSRSLSSTELAAYFSELDNVEYAEPHYLFLKNQPPVLPNDIFYPDYQWNLSMIGAESGWNFSRGSEDVTIAVVDTGVDLNHPDLQKRLTRGYNVLKDNNHPVDDNGHGTHVAGIIASETNNREGVAGITWFNHIMPVKVMNREGSGTSFDIAKGVMWAVDHGADVINMSLGNYQPSAIMEEAIDYAFDHDVVLVAASGNDNTDQPGFPAAYPQVLGISAIRIDGKRAVFSNYGDYIDVAAPGVDIASTYPHQQYAELSGTSMAAPHVTALAGLIRSLYPSLTNREVMTIIKKTAVDLGEPGVDEFYGSGLIDVIQALKMTYREKYPLGRLSEWFERAFG